MATTDRNAAVVTDQRSSDHASVVQNMFDNASFEEYLYFAKVSRADERYEATTHDYTFFGKLIKKSSNETPAEQLAKAQRISSQPIHREETNDDIKLHEKAIDSSNEQSPLPAYTVTDEEYVNASRALRNASWGGVFYLITVDILGPYGTPYALAAMGWGPGIILYTIFGALAFYCGMLLLRCFLQLDSDRYPLTSYGDIAYRIFGEWARQIVNILQTIQLVANVAIICVSNGQSLEQIIVTNGKPSVCYVVCILIWAIVGTVIICSGIPLTRLGAIGGQIRTLQKLSWVANFAVWINLFIIFGTMAEVAFKPVNSEAAISLNTAYNIQPGDPPSTTAGLRPGLDFTIALQGLMVAVFAYGGASTFVEFMAEMKRPFDFWKGMFCAQIFIYFFYVFYGGFVYAFQGQYSINPAFQGVVDTVWQSVFNALYIITGTIAGLLYANISIKVLYNHILLRHFKFPHLSTRGGKLAWAAVVPIYWALSFIIGAAIPQISSLQSFIGAVAILQFSYTFPLALIVGLLVKRDAMLEGDGFDPATNTVIRQDSGIKRWVRGFKKRWFFNTTNVILCLGSLVTAILGAYAAIIQIQVAFASGNSSSFTCQSPFD